MRTDRLIDRLPAAIQTALLATWNGTDIDLDAFDRALEAHEIDGTTGVGERAVDRLMVEIFAINHPTRPAPVPKATTTPGPTCSTN